jgi:hypothetical protein
MLTISTPPKYIEIVEHPNHFYEFIFKQATRVALDEWFVYIEQLYQLPKDTSVKVLVDTTATVQPPLSHAFRQAQALVKKYPMRPKPMRYVFMGAENQGVMHRILQSFIQILNTGDSTFYIYGEKRSEALDLLFVNEPQLHPTSAPQPK